MGMRGVAQQPGALRAQRKDLRDDAVVVVLATVVAAADERAPHLFAQLASRGVSQEWFDARACVQDRPFALLAAAVRRRGRAGDQRIRQAREIRFAAEDQGLVVFLCEDVLAEIRVQRGEALVDRREPLLRLGVQVRAGAHEVGVVEPGEALLFAAETGLIAFRVDGGDACKQLLVLGDAIAERGKFRRHVALDGLHGRVVQRRGVDAEHGADPVELAARFLQCGNRVREAGCGWIGCNAIDRGELQRHACFERRL